MCARRVLLAEQKRPAASWTGGAANIAIALALGAILAGFYLWRRDLIANMIGHFAVDFVANVLPKLFS